MRKTMKSIEDLINTFENTGDNGIFFIGDYSNIEIATYIRQQKEEIEKLNNNWNKLKEWANEPKVYICHYHILDKMNEIEGRNDAK